MTHKAYPERARDRIKAGMLMRRLHDFVVATPLDDDYLEKMMTSSQVTAAKTLLAKVLPDLKQTEHTGDINHHHTEELSNDQIAARLAEVTRRRIELTEGDAKAALCDDESAIVH
jgi:hypothetical protein